MQKLILSFILLFQSNTLWANGSFEELVNQARAQFNERARKSPGLENAQKAADTYAKAAEVEDLSDVDKASALMGQSEALYFFSHNQTDKKQKIKWHKKGGDVAKVAKDLLEAKEGEPKNPANASLLAEVYYWYGANMGQWAQARGILPSLNKWPELKRYMNHAIKLDETVQSYGPHRILGKAYAKLPFPLGSNKTAKEHLEKAYKQTLHQTYEISTYSVNVVYYAELLIAMGDEDQARDMLGRLLSIAQDGNVKDYNPSRVPETMEDVEAAAEILDNL